MEGLNCISFIIYWVRLYIFICVN